MQRQIPLHPVVAYSHFHVGAITQKTICSEISFTTAVIVKIAN